MSAPSTPSFTHFKSLPAELRLMIWQLNLPVEREVRVHYNIQTGRFYSTTPSPTNLQICRESRLEATSRWPLQFGTPGHPAQIRANFLIDHIRIDFDPIRLKAIPGDALKEIRWLEVGETDLQRIPTDRLLAQLQDFRSLTNLTIVAPEPEPLCLEYHKEKTTRDKLADQGNLSGEDSVMPDRVRLEFQGHMERRFMAFQQHNSLTKQMLSLKSASKRWQMPTLWLVPITADGEREGPYVWKFQDSAHAGSPGYHARLGALEIREILE